MDPVTNTQNVSVLEQLNHSPRILVRAATQQEGNTQVLSHGKPPPTPAERDATMTAAAARRVCGEWEDCGLICHGTGDAATESKKYTAVAPNVEVLESRPYPGCESCRIVC